MSRTARRLWMVFRRVRQYLHTMAILLHEMISGVEPVDHKAVRLRRRRQQTALDLRRIEQDSSWAERAQEDLDDVRRRLRAEGWL